MRVARRGCIVACAALAVVALLAPVSGQGFGVSGGRIDLGDLERGEGASAAFVVRADDGGPSDVVVTVENDPQAAIVVTPATATIPAGGALTVEITLAVPADATPGRHQPAVLVSQTTTVGGNSAGGAVRVPVTYVVAAVDAAVAQVTPDGQIQVRVVNGHTTARTVTVDATSGLAPLAHAAGPLVLGPGASWLLEWAPDWAQVANGTHLLELTGEASGGVAETFTASYQLVVSGASRQIGGTTAPTNSPGGGGGGGRLAPAPPEPTPPADVAPGDPPRSPRGAGLPSSPAELGLDGRDRGSDAARFDEVGTTDGPGPGSDPAPRPPATWAISAGLAMAALAAAASGLRRAFKNHGGKNPPSGGP